VVTGVNATLFFLIIIKAQTKCTSGFVRSKLFSGYYSICREG